jgi:hypothetical protein
MSYIPGSISNSRFNGGIPKSTALKKQFGVNNPGPFPASLAQRIVQTPIGGQVNGVVIDTKTKYRANFALNTQKQYQAQRRNGSWF